MVYWAPWVATRFRSAWETEMNGLAALAFTLLPPMGFALRQLFC